MQSMVKEKLGSSRCKVVVPVRPGLAVLRGAVLFGKNQDIFASRVARSTYGFKHTETYDPDNPLHHNRATEVYTKNGVNSIKLPRRFKRLVKVCTAPLTRPTPLPLAS